MSSSPGQKILMGCGIAAIAVVGFFLLMIGGCFGLLVKGIVDYPAYAKAEVVNPANKDVTDRIDQIISESASKDQAQQKIAAEAWPQKVLFIGIGFKTDEPLPKEPDTAFKRGAWDSPTTFRSDANGYGSLHTSSGAVDFVIIDRTQETSKGLPLRYTLYIEHLRGNASP